MNLTQLQTIVGTVVGNLGQQSSHPFYKFIFPASGNESESVINRAGNRLITLAAGANGQNAGLFPELRNSWTVGPTTAGTNTYSTPSDAVVITDVQTARDLTDAQASTPPNWNITREYPLTYMAPEMFGILTKDSTVTNFPAIWSKKGKTILVWPTPDALHLDYMRWYGLKIENVLVGPSDTFFMNPVWHDLVATLASEMLARMMGWTDQANELMQQFQVDLAGTMNVVAMEEQIGAFSVEGAPTHASIYGR